MKYPQLNLNKNQGPQIKLATDLGTIKLQLFIHEAPQAVENMVRLTEKKYYDGTIFHRVVNNFMIQGCDPTGTGEGGSSIWGHEFADEISDNLFHFRGALALANDGPNTNISQFYIVQNYDLPDLFTKEIETYGYPQEIVDEYQKGGAPWLDGRFTILGQVFAGMDVVDQIARVKTNRAGKPLTNIKLNKAEVLK